MKLKLLTFIIIFAVMMPLITIPAMAASKVVDITRPEGNEIVTKDVFSICGVCLYDETTIEFSYKDKETGKYKPLETVEGYSDFKVGNNKLFGKEIVLKYKGENEIKVTAYTKSTKEDPQENYYKITLTEEKKKDNWFTDIGKTIQNWLEKN